MLAYSISMLFASVHSTFHFHKITLYLIIARDTLILLNTFLNELMGTKKIGHFKDGAIPTILAHVKAKKNESYQSGILKWLLKSKWEQLKLYDFKEIKIKEY